MFESLSACLLIKSMPKGFMVVRDDNFIIVVDGETAYIVLRNYSAFDRVKELFNTKYMIIIADKELYDKLSVYYDKYDKLIFAGLAIYNIQQRIKHML